MNRDPSELERQCAARVLERTIELSSVPAPPLDEADRAATIVRWWHDDHIAAVSTDEIGNVWGCIRPGEGPAVLVAAHLDTVFDRATTHGARRHGDDLLVGPGVGDDTVAVASLAELRHLLDPTGPPIWILATVGEEGLGNLAGITAALAAPPQRLGAVIALEGNYLGRVNAIGVGSVRYRIIVSGPGGHSWEHGDAPSALHHAARLVHQLDQMPRPTGRCTVNVGVMSGGESINARARQASFDLDIRSDEPAALAEVDIAARAMLSAPYGPLKVSIQELGRRPAGHTATAHPLVIAALRALTDFGVTGRVTAASTDANAAYAAGLPAVTLGITEGDGTHTEDEWIRISPIVTGLRALARTLVLYQPTKG